MSGVGFHIRGSFVIYCVFVWYDISKALDSNSELNVTSLQSILRGLKIIISISESISGMLVTTHFEITFIFGPSQRALKKNV